MELYKVVRTKNTPLNTIVYGEPGSGKTTFAASAQNHPAMKDVLFLNIEGGLLTLVDRGDIRATDIRTVEELEEAFWELHHGKDGLDKIRTVVIDSGTELQTLSLEGIAKAAKDKNPSKREDQDTFEQRDYLKSTNNLKRVLRYFRDMDKNVIITALPKYVYPKSGDEQEPTECMPSFTSKLSTALQGYVDNVWYIHFDKEKQKRYLITQPRGIYKAKTRGQAFSEKLGAIVEDPDMTKIYNTFITAGDK